MLDDPGIPLPTLFLPGRDLVQEVVPVNDFAMIGCGDVANFVAPVVVMLAAVHNDTELLLGEIVELIEELELEGDVLKHAASSGYSLLEL
ncbi:hypothetical protein LTR84_000210 [Exophiala bonariae]|uniref:Uncharacterized protein n=1 Tax=Exophiala bonariae TaxID=1690606 RepID=A0AAV9NQB7_9EURO|nr:hypothetical protein LTR84_000210 [Exophiala bonariae]